MRELGASANLTRRRSYSNPPIRERVLEVHVIPGPTTIPTAREVFAKRWSDFTDVEEVVIGGYQFTLDFASEAVESKRQQDVRLRFWKPGRKEQLLQVGRELFAANDLTHEPGWDALQPLFESRYRDFREVMQPLGVAKGVLRYLNRIDVPDGVMPSDLLKIFPRLPDEQTRRAPFQMVVDEGSEKAGPAIIALSYPIKDKNDRSLYAFDITVESGKRSLDKVDAVSEWAKEAHDRVIELFESSITSKARDLFGVRR